MTKKFTTIVLILFLFGLAGLVYYYSQTFTKEIKKGAVVLNVDPKNATYSIEGREITLVNGEGTSGNSVTSLDYYDAILAPLNQVGDVDGDGAPENLVVVSYNSGGTGVFSYLGVVKSGLDPIPTVFIGDRVSIKNISVNQGIITINYLDRGEGEPMAVMPTVPKVLKVKLSNNQLINLNGQ